jgi:hypothetical protein
MAATAAVAVTATSEALTEIAFCELHQTGLMPVFFVLAALSLQKLHSAQTLHFQTEA